MTNLHQKIFLIDGIGALVSAILLGIVLVALEPYIGMPPKVLYVLALLAGAFAVYSLTCHIRVKTNRGRYLRIIAIVNLLYCCLTLGLVFYFREQVTIWGWLYFVGEIIIVSTLARMELKIAKTI
jgi:uncharacterized membrane protein YsdA (DUF1294 family)